MLINKAQFNDVTLAIQKMHLEIRSLSAF